MLAEARTIRATTVNEADAPGAIRVAGDDRASLRSAGAAAAFAVAVGVAVAVTSAASAGKTHAMPPG